jgi:hypothetical protein
MREAERIWAVKELLFDYVKSPSLRRISVAPLLVMSSTALGLHPRFGIIAS